LLTEYSGCLLALRGDLSEARASLAEAIRLKPGTNSVAKYLSDPETIMDHLMLNAAPYRALVEKTVVVGLRRVGLPDE
jgi:hypothetical protein